MERKLKPGELNEFGGITMRDCPEPTDPEPTFEQMEHWVFDSVCEATDGCTVEPDGVCPHGHVSWLMYVGII